MVSFLLPEHPKSAQVRTQCCGSILFKPMSEQTTTAGRLGSRGGVSTARRGRRGVWDGPAQQHRPVQSSGASFFFLILFIYFYFWLSWVFAALLGLSLVEASRDYSLAVVPRLLAAVTSLAVERCNFKLANTGAA